MMLYAALAMWLMVIVFTAWGVHHIWCGLVRPRAVNLVLLPGTLVAQLGYAVGVLVSGGTLNTTTVIKDDETAEPQQAENPQPRIPVLGPILIGMLPLATCAAGLYIAARQLGKDVVRGIGADHLPQGLPLSLVAFWQLLRDMITLAENAIDAVRVADPFRLTTIVFVYLVVCLTVRMAPFPGNLRGAIGAIALVGLVTGILSLVTPRTEDIVLGGWPVLSLAVASLVALLLITLVIRGVVALVRVLAQQG